MMDFRLAFRRRPSICLHPAGKCVQQEILLIGAATATAASQISARVQQKTATGAFLLVLPYCTYVITVPTVFDGIGGAGSF